MKCPGNTIACEVKKIKSSKEKVGSGPVRVLYHCSFHGYFVLYHDINALSGFSGEPIDIG